MSSETALDTRWRLKARALELGLDFQQAVLYYAMERFLFRLSQTPWSERFVVKGAAMLRVWDAAVARPTRDIDFLGRVNNTPEAIRDIRHLDAVALLGVRRSGSLKRYACDVRAPRHRASF